MNKPIPSIFHDALQVSPQRIAIMSDEDLSELMRQLLLAQAYRCDSPLKEIRVNTEGNASDDGCDGWSAKPLRPDGWLGSSDTCWQFKAGSTGEPKQLVGEVDKRIPRETLTNGGRYIVIASGSKNGKKGEQDRLKTLIKDARAAGILTQNIEVFGNERLTIWCNQHPAVAAYWAGRPNGLWTLEDWSNSDEHRVPWQASDDVQLEINRRREGLDFATGDIYHLHIYGPPGVGKTRFALELCRDAAWRGAVIYIRQAADIRLEELLDSAATDPSVQLTIVADEVQPDQLRPLRDSVGRSSGRVRLITVGHSPSPDPTRIPALLVKPLEPEIMQKVIKGWYPAMPLEHVDFVVRFADGYVRLARLAADAVARNPGLNVRGLLSHDEIRAFLDNMLGTGSRRELYVVAVLTSVGWTEEKQNEGKAISEHLDLDWNSVRAIVDDFDRRLGIAPRGGRYRYISPTPLGIHLAVEAWTTYPELLKSLLGVLPSEDAQDAYYNRLQSIASNPQAQEYAREELALFFRVDDFMDARSVRRWSAISSADPDKAARNILKALKGVGVEDRRKIRDNARREMVWTLVRLAWRSSSFQDAVKSLALLAEAENETWANNATAEFIARFQILLGGTAVPYLDRLSAIDELLEDENPLLASLVVRALSKVGERHSSRMVTHPASDELPEREWRPRTPSEHLECVEASIARLINIAKLKIPNIQADLIAAAMSLSLMLRESALREHVAEYFDTLREVYPETREPLRRVIADIIQRERKFWKVLSPEELGELETLHARFEDSSLGARLHQYVGPASWDPEEQLNLLPLAEELLSTPDVLMEQWPWLTSGEAMSVWQLGEALAVADSEGMLAEILPSIPNSGHDLRLLCSYISIRRQTLGDEWYDKWVASQFERVPKPIVLIFEVAWRCGATEAVANMLTVTLQSNQVGPQIVGQLGFGRWADNLPANVLEGVLRAMMDSGNSETAIGILEPRMKSNTAECEQWKPLALNLVENPHLFRHEGMVSYHWKEIASILVGTFSREIAVAIFREKANRERGYWFMDQGEATEVLVACARQDPKAVWDEMKPYLMHPGGYRFIDSFPRVVLDFISVDDIEIWVAEKPEERAEMIASFVSLDLSTDKTLAARIIGKYSGSERVASTFFSQYISGGWTGSAYEHWIQMAESLKEIAGRTKLPKLRRWASESTRHLQKMAEEDRKREEEWNLRGR